MPTNYPIAPDTPLPISLLPPVETPTKDDLLLVTQPGQPLGQRSRSMTLGAMFASDPFKAAASSASAAVYSNIVHVTAETLPQKGTSDWEFICKADVPFHSNAIYCIWGSSGPATDGSSGTNYEYGLNVKARSVYLPDDQDRELEMAFPAGYKAGSTLNPANAHYVARGSFWNQYTEPSASELAAYPNKTLSLRVQQGMSASPYQADKPHNFDFYVQFIVLPYCTYKGDLLKVLE